MLFYPLKVSLVINRKKISEISRIHKGEKADFLGFEIRKNPKESRKIRKNLKKSQKIRKSKIEGSFQQCFPIIF